jgi:hypothetical protein
MGSNRGGVSLLSPEDGNTQFPKRCFLVSRIPVDGQSPEPRNPECHTPSPETLRFYLYRTLFCRQPLIAQLQLSVPRAVKARTFSLYIPLFRMNSEGTQPISFSAVHDAKCS